MQVLFLNAGEEIAKHAREYNDMLVDVMDSFTQVHPALTYLHKSLNTADMSPFSAESPDLPLVEPKTSLQM